MSVGRFDQRSGLNLAEKSGGLVLFFARCDAAMRGGRKYVLLGATAPSPQISFQVFTTRICKGIRRVWECMHGIVFGVDRNLHVCEREYLWVPARHQCNPS